MDFYNIKKEMERKEMEPSRNNKIIGIVLGVLAWIPNGILDLGRDPFAGVVTLAVSIFVGCALVRGIAGVWVRLKSKTKSEARKWLENRGNKRL